jgi:hypothetical protein
LGNWSNRSQYSLWGKPKQKTGYLFAPLFKKYCELFPKTKICFITFKNHNMDAQMVKALKENVDDIDERLIQFRLDTQKPDLTRLDKMLAQISEFVSSNTGSSEVDSVNEVGENIKFTFEPISI